MPRTNAEELRLKLSQQIIELCKQQDWKPGRRITERQLATELGVSRSPVRSALEYLSTLGAIERLENGGYIVAIDNAASNESLLELPSITEETLYVDILRDRFKGVLPEHVSEADLMRQYDVSRGRLLKLLMRLSHEGFVVRSAGHGWQFKEFLQTVAAYRASYEFRIAIEPAALRSPNYVPDIARLEKLKTAHQELLSNFNGEKSSYIAQFDLDAELHETIAAFSKNQFMLDAIRHHNRLRRVVEYESIATHERTDESLEEHLELIDALIADDREWASSLLIRHLELASRSVEAFMPREA